MAAKQKLGLIEQHSKQLETLRQERQALSRDLYKDLNESEVLFENIATMSAAKVEGELSKLDQGLSQYGNYRQTIAELAEGLTDNLTEYVQFAAEGQNYQGVEKFLAVLAFAHKMADKHRIERLRTQSPRENLQLILDYGEQLFKEICEVREDAIGTSGTTVPATTTVSNRLRLLCPGRRQAGKLARHPVKGNTSSTRPTLVV